MRASSLFLIDTVLQETTSFRTPLSRFQRSLPNKRPSFTTHKPTINLHTHVVKPSIPSLYLMRVFRTDAGTRHVGTYRHRDGFKRFAGLGIRERGVERSGREVGLSTVCHDVIIR